MRDISGSSPNVTCTPCGVGPRRDKPKANCGFDDSDGDIDFDEEWMVQVEEQQLKHTQASRGSSGEATTSMSVPEALALQCIH